MELNESEVLAAVENQIREDHTRLSGVTFEPPKQSKPTNETKFIGYSGESRSFLRRGVRALREGEFLKGIHHLLQGLRKFDQAGPFRQ